MFTPSVRSWLLGAFCSVLIASSWTTRTSAVQHISQVHWTPEFSVSYPSRTRTTLLDFDADLTASDIYSGTTSFAIAVLHEDGSTDVLARFSCGPTYRGLSAGTKAHFALAIGVDCSTAGEVGPAITSALVRYQDPYFDARREPLRSTYLTVRTQMNEELHLVLLDAQERSVEAAASPSFRCNPQPTSDADGSIGVYFDPLGTLCQGRIPAGTTGKIYIVAHLGGATAGGIAGAEFRFTGLPEAWEAHAVADPNILALGDPFGSGVVLGFVCQPPTEGTVLLYEVLVIAKEDVEDVRFQIVSRDPPLTDPCPLLLQCDDPLFTASCAAGQPCYVNYGVSLLCPQGPSPLGVETTTWTTLKGLYR